MNRIFVMLAMLTVYIVGSCQEFKEGILYDVFGNVKEVKLETRNSYLKKHVKFQKDGRCKVSAMLFDDKGYPLGFSMYYGKHGVGQQLRYDSMNRVDSIIVNSSNGGGTERVEKHEYSSDASHPNQIVRSVFSSISKKESDKLVCDYSNYEYDDHGNWISRDVVQTNYSDDGAEKGKEEYSEKRKIQYY